MIRVLINLQEIVEVHGIASFFTEWPAPLGTYAPDAVAWCRLIGAKRQATYLKRALSLFPRGRPPADGAAALLAVDRIEKRAPNAFLDLDEKFKGSEAEIPTRLRRHLLDHDVKLALALAAGRAAAQAEATFPAVLSTRKPLEFLEKLIDLFAPASGAERMAAWTSAKPNAAIMLQVLHGLYFDVGAEGIARFLSSPFFGGFATQAAQWCRAMGAGRAARYVDDAVKLFPRGKVPTDDDARADIVERLMDDHRGRGPSPLRKLDQRYDGAVDEMVKALRAYLRERAEAPLEALEALARGGQNAGPRRAR
jgi:hypothetical protein